MSCSFHSPWCWGDAPTSPHFSGYVTISLGQWKPCPRQLEVLCVVCNLSTLPSRTWNSSRRLCKCLKESTAGENAPPAEEVMKTSSPELRSGQKVTPEWGEGRNAQQPCPRISISAATAQGYMLLEASFSPPRTQIRIPWTWGIMTEHWFAFPLQMWLLKWSQNYFQVKS